MVVSDADIRAGNVVEHMKAVNRTRPGATYDLARRGSRDCHAIRHRGEACVRHLIGVDIAATLGDRAPAGEWGGPTASKAGDGS